MGQTASEADAGMIQDLPLKEGRLMKTQRSQARGVSLRRGASLPSAAPPLPDEEFIQLPPGALAALAKLQDPDGYRRLTHSSDSMGCKSQGWKEEVDVVKTPGKSEFVIYENASLILPSRGFSPIPNSAAPLSPTPVKARGPLSPAAGRRAAVQDCPLPPPPPPSPDTDMPKIVVYSTPPRTGRCNVSASPAPSAGSQAARESETVDTVDRVVEGALRDIGNRQDTLTSWQGLVKLSNSRRVQGRGGQQRRQFKLEVAQTPPFVNRLIGKDFEVPYSFHDASGAITFGKENSYSNLSGRRESILKASDGKDGIQQRQLAFSPECTREKVATSVPTLTSIGRRKMCCPCA